MRSGASFVVELDSDLSADEVLRRVLDLRAHDRLIPLTTVSPAVPAEELVPGFHFVGRTGVGPVGFDDPMRVEAFDWESTSARLVKEGRVIRGSVEVHVTATNSGSELRWVQVVDLPWLPRFVQPFAARVVRLGYRQVIKKLLRTPTVD